MSTNLFYLSTDSSPSIVCRGKVDWLQNGFEIKFITENTAFKGIITESQLEIQCQFLSLSKANFLEQCRIALLTKGDVSEFHYILENDCFIIKKRLEMNSSIHMNVIFLKIFLEKISFAETIIEILDAAINWSYYQLEENKKLLSKNEQLQIANDDAIKYLKKMERDKVSYEEILYKKFLNLLNSKKSGTSHHEEQPSTSEQNDNERVANSSEEKLADDTDIFDVETDIDDDDVITEYPVTTQTCFKDVNENKANSSDTKVNVKSDIGNIIDSMAFLDPTIPFLS